MDWGVGAGGGDGGADACVAGSGVDDLAYVVVDVYEGRFGVGEVAEDEVIGDFEYIGGVFNVLSYGFSGGFAGAGGYFGCADEVLEEVYLALDGGECGWSEAVGCECGEVVVEGVVNVLCGGCEVVFGEAFEVVFCGVEYLGEVVVFGGNGPCVCEACFGEYHFD